MINDQVSGTRSNRNGHRFIRRFAAAAAISVGVLGVSNIQSASAATPCASMFASCGWLGYNPSATTLYAMQQNDMLQAQTIFAAVSAQQSAQSAQRWQTMQTSQTSIFAITQDVTAMVALRANSALDLMAGYVR